MREGRFLAAVAGVALLAVGMVSCGSRGASPAAANESGVPSPAGEVVATAGDAGTAATGMGAEGDAAPPGTDPTGPEGAPALPARLEAVVQLPTGAFLHAVAEAAPHGGSFTACVLPAMEGACEGTVTSSLDDAAWTELTRLWRAANAPPIPCQQLVRSPGAARYRIVPEGGEARDGTLPDDRSEEALAIRCETESRLAWWFARRYDALPDF
jgi:hypothetical protein